MTSRSDEVADGLLSQLGIIQYPDSRLKKPCNDVGDITVESFRRDRVILRKALEGFRSTYGFGRAIAAPQVGLAGRLIAFDVDGYKLDMINPNIVHRSPEFLSLWDDCMSFPHLLVRVRRNLTIDVTFTDGNGSAHLWRDVPPTLSELIQHEVDHLDGILALDRAINGRRDVIERATFERNLDRFWALVDPPPDRAEGRLYLERHLIRQKRHPRSQA